MNKTEENALLLERAAKGDKAAEELIIKNNMGLVKSVAMRFVGRGQEPEDLIQIGCMGMLKALRGFDPSYNTAFSTYAVPLIAGEIKRFLRDDGLIKVSREAKKNYYLLMREKEAFLRENGREPKLSELCEKCGFTDSEALYAMEACSGTVSLQDKISEEDDRSVEDLCADSELGDLTEKIALREVISELEPKQKNIIYMRYFKGMTQSEVAKRLGTSQVKVSREESKIKKELREKLIC